MSSFRTFCIMVIALVFAQAAAAAPLKCRVLYRLTCAPDVCTPIDKMGSDGPQIPNIQIVISTNRRRLTYVERGRKRSAAISVKRLGKDLRLVSGRFDGPHMNGGRPTAGSACLGRFV